MKKNRFIIAIFFAILLVSFTIAVFSRPAKIMAASGIWGSIVGSSLSEYQTSVSNSSSKLVPTDTWGSMTLKNGNTFSYIIHTSISGTCRSYRVEGKVTSPTNVLLADEYDPMGYNTTCSGAEAFANGSMFMLADSNGRVTAYFKTYTQPYMSGPTYYYHKQGISDWVWDSPSLTANLAANPNSGVSPLNTTLTATPGGNVTGTINYSFWWNCNSTSSTYAATVMACGDPHTSTIGAKFDGTSANPQTVSHSYSPAGTYYGKVIIERGSLTAEKRATITVNSPPAPTVTLTANGSSGSTTIAYNASANLAWSSSNATSCNAAWTTSTATSGTQTTGNLIASKSYSITCVNGNSNANANVNVVVTPPALTASLSANPANGPAPLGTSLTANAGGTATGTLNYSFWWNCNSTAMTYAAAVTACGDPHTATIGFKKDGISNILLVATNTYTPAGADYGKVIIERGALSAESRATVTVTSAPQTLTASLVANPVSGPITFSPELTAIPGGTATGTISYSFWWNCNSIATTYMTTLAACGSPQAKFDGVTDIPKKTMASYSSVGIFTVKVVIERGTLSAESRVAVTANTTPTLTAELIAMPSSGLSPLNTTLTATTGGSMTGSINYTFWWDCSTPGSDYASTVAACGNPLGNPNIGDKTHDGVTTTLLPILHAYTGAGIYHTVVVIERGSLAKVATADVTVAPAGNPSSIRVDVNVGWDERGEPKSVDYYSVLENLNN